jgi:hypothetical protein
MPVPVAAAYRQEVFFVNYPRLVGKPWRQVVYVGVQPSSRLALSLDAPRICVIIDTPDVANYQAAEPDRDA